VSRFPEAPQHGPAAGHGPGSGLGAELPAGERHGPAAGSGPGPGGERADGDDHQVEGVPAGDGGHPDPGPARPRRRRRWRRRLAVGGVVAVLAGGGAAAAVALRGSGDDDPDAVATSAVDLGTAEVERRTLEEHAELDGTLGYGDVSQISIPARGTVTGLPEVGQVVDRGQTLVEVDGRPVPLLFGDRPLWRPLGPGADDGVDIQQLEANLVALGVAGEAELTVDQTWTDATTEAVEDWQASLSLDETGTVEPGSVVFQPAAVRVAEHTVVEGGALGGGPALGVTGTTRQITVDLEATRQGLLAVDQAVTVELPDGSETTGSVQEIGTVAESAAPAEGGGGEEEADPTIEVTIALDDPAAGGELDQAPVTVRAVTSAATDVLAVPLEALLVRAGGEFAVEVRRADGTTEPVTVELGAFADGWVEVTGELSEGDEVVVPVD
jgi:hypothetical protein